MLSGCHRAGRYAAVNVLPRKAEVALRRLAEQREHERSEPLEYIVAVVVTQPRSIKSTVCSAFFEKTKSDHVYFGNAIGLRSRDRYSGCAGCLVATFIFRHLSLMKGLHASLSLTCESRE